jgi:hypothetical protein
MPVNETSGEGARGFTYTVTITRRSNQPTEDAETASYNEASESWAVSAATAEAIRGLVEQAAGGDEPTWDPQDQPDAPQSQPSTARRGTMAGQTTSVTEGGVETEG